MMKNFRKKIKPISVFVLVLMVMMTVPVHSVLAAMIETETVVELDRVLQTRAYLNEFIARQDVQTLLNAQGIDPAEAKARVNSLTDDEVIKIADRIEQLPAGGNGFLGFLLVLALIVFLVLVITDLTGVTDVFPFVKSQR
jgi:hypothetical protein